MEREKRQTINLLVSCSIFASLTRLLSYVTVSKLCASGGAHKPTYYAFGNDEKIDLEFYAAENK